MKLAEIFDCMSTAVLVCNEAGECLYSNEACQALLVRSNRWLQGKHFRDIFHTSPELLELGSLTLQQAQSLVLREQEILLPDWHRSLLVDVNISPCLPQSEAALIIELTDRKEVSKLSHDSNATAIFEAATRIVRGLCHEIKNPLGGIRGAAQLLSLEPDSSDVLEYTAVITHEVDRLNALLSRMSSGAGALERIQLDIHQPMAQIAHLMTAEFGPQLEIGFDFDTSLPRIEANQDALKQLLLNMIRNAAQWAQIAHHKNRGGDIETALPSVVLTTRTAHPDLRRTLMPQQGIHIQISDNGPGVDAAIVDQLFLPMVTRREGGTGLGLSISQEIARSYGGFIELDQSNEYEGACFSIYLPFKQIQTEHNT